MKKSIIFPGVIGIILLLTALVFRLLVLPNQILIILAGSASIFLAGHIAYLVYRMKQKEKMGGKITELAIYLALLSLTVFLFYYFYSHGRGLYIILWAVPLIACFTYYLFPVIRGHSPERQIHFGFALMYIIGILLLWLTNPIAFQIPDKTYNPPIPNPAYPEGKGSIVLIDEAHHNFHTLSGRYFAFARLLQQDGYRVQSLEDPISLESLKNCHILVIANALNEKNVENWSNPIYPAFTPDEIDVLENWVTAGGNLFLIADHMPMPGAVEEIGQRFGFTMHNGFNSDSVRGPDLFTRADSTLFPSPILTTADGVEIDSFVSFTGHGFNYPPDATPVFLFRKGSFILMPEVAWEFSPTTPKLDAEGMSQLAYKKHGEGRIVVSGEAAMFTSQSFGGLSWRKGGMGSPVARNNYKLLLNIIHWLDGLQD